MKNRLVGERIGVSEMEKWKGRIRTWVKEEAKRVLEMVVIDHFLEIKRRNGRIRPRM